MTRNPAFIAAFFPAMIITACFTAKGAGPAKLQVTLTIPITRRVAGGCC